MLFLAGVSHTTDHGTDHGATSSLPNKKNANGRQPRRHAEEMDSGPAGARGALNASVSHSHPMERRRARIAGLAGPRTTAPAAW